MFSFKKIGIAIAAAALMTTPALAAQVVTIDLTAPDADGYVYGSGNFSWPSEGTWTNATIDFTGLQLIDATLTGYVEGRATWWDEAIGGVTGNEYSLAYDCAVWNGCLSQSTANRAIGRISTPRGFDEPCTPATLGDCSFHYYPQGGVFDGYFQVVSPTNPYSVTLTIGDFSAVPEPAAWALMIVGFGLAGGAVRRQRQVGLPA